MTDAPALFDLPALTPAPAAPSQRRKLPGCRTCGGPLTDWCRAVDALPETGSWSAADRVIAQLHAERDRRRTA